AKKYAIVLCDAIFISGLNNDALYIPPTASFCADLISRYDSLKESLIVDSGFQSQRWCWGYTTPDNAQKSRGMVDRI
ncbi:hypothetical protein, partial [uncultured Duncaniella sp.]|uniref:hypothetical protein n=1 Tax=uncultured Duncaniella sp. TaxID=2768039 RepID=UPI002731E67D